MATRNVRAATPFSAIIALAALLLSPQASADRHVRFEDCPAAVQQTIRNEVGNGVIEDIEEEFKWGQRVYEVEFYANGRRWEIDIDESGRVLKREEDD